MLSVILSGFVTRKIVRHTSDGNLLAIGDLFSINLYSYVMWSFTKQLLKRDKWATAGRH